jgi:OOP family OmpA-OmpF porin
MNKKMHSRPATVALAAALASCCAALAAPSASAQAFVGASVGGTRWSDVDCTTALSCDRHDTGGSVRAGYRFLPWFAVEARYFDLGRARIRGSVLDSQTGGATPGLVAQEDLSAKGAGIDAVFSWPVADRVSVSGMVGIARSEARSDFTIDFDPSLFEGVSFPATDTVRKTNPYYGLGVSFAVTPQFAVSLEAERYRIGTPADATVSVDQLGATVVYQFR